MIALLQHYLPLLATPLAGGLFVGWFATGGRPSRPGWVFVVSASLALAAALASATLGVVPGRAGLLLDTALLFTLTYLAGCGLGALLRFVYSPHEPA